MTTTIDTFRRNGMRDALTVMMRELRPMARDPFSVIFSLVQPLVFLGLFTPLLVGSSDESTAQTLAWFVPGVLVMIVLFGTGAVGSNLQYEMMTGSHERTLVAPLSRSALLAGRALKEIVPIAVQAVVIVLVAWPFGFHPNLIGVLAGVVVLAVFGVGLGSLSYALALKTKEHEWMFWAVQQTLIFPLLILSGMLLPLDAGPRWMSVISSVNPINWVVQAERHLLAGDFAATPVLWGAISAIGVAAVGLAVGIRAMRSSD